jgi:hypothetical protein
MAEFDNIPVLVDIIHEHDNPEDDAAIAEKKQRTLWDANGVAIEEAMTDEAANEETATDEAVTESVQADAAGSVPSGDEPVVAFYSDESADETPVEIDDLPDEAYAGRPDTEDSHDDLDTEAEVWHGEDNHHIPPATDATPAAQLRQIDIDALADKILRQLKPDLDNYLSERLRIALKSALDEKSHD